MIVSRRIKVLQLQTRYNADDTNSDLGSQILNGLPAGRFEVVNAYLEGQPAAASTSPWREVYFDFDSREMSGLRLNVRRKLAAFCRHEGFDVAVLHRFKAVNLFLHLNRTLKIPLCIGVSHGFGEYDRFYRRWQARRLIDDKWRFVGVSPAVCEYLIAQRCGFTHANTLPITNAIDIDLAESNQLDAITARAALDLPTQATVVGVIGRLVPVKGHSFLIEAFARVAEAYPDALLAIIGGGREEEQLRALIQLRGLTQRVRLCGPRADAMKYVRAFDLFAMPSLQEGLGLALLEGMCGRLPVMGSDIPAMRPLLQGAGGRIFPPGNIDAIARVLEEALSLTPAQRDAEGARAYEYLRREHAIDDFRQKYRQLIESKLPERAE